MEIGLGFLVGALAGVLVSIVATMIIMVSRKAIKKGAAEPAYSPAEPVVAAAPIAQAAPKPDAPPLTVEPPRRHGATTMILESFDDRDVQLSNSIQEVKALLLRLADVISKTDDVSGKADKVFTSARNVVDKIDPRKPEGLVDAQRILMGEIDRMLKTNAQLHGELAKANKGIAEQRKQIEDLRVQARIDGLTRIPNRASFDERLKEYLSLLDRTGMAFTLLLLDIDLFKKVNDDHGHINGDRILRGVAAKISDSIRTNDFAARYGGEEFAVILPGTRMEEAITVAERVRADIARTNFRLDDQTVKMTISGGMAESRKGMDAEAIVSAADRALYRAKSEGRNRVEMEKQ